TPHTSSPPSRNAQRLPHVIPTRRKASRFARGGTFAPVRPLPARPRPLPLPCQRRHLRAVRRDRRHLPHPAGPHGRLARLAAVAPPRPTLPRPLGCPGHRPHAPHLPGVPLLHALYPPRSLYGRRIAPPRHRRLPLPRPPPTPLDHHRLRQRRFPARQPRADFRDLPRHGAVPLGRAARHPAPAVDPRPYC